MNGEALMLQEEYSAKIPALMLLANLGWEYLSPKEAMALRGGRDQVILTPILREVLTARQFVVQGKPHSLDKSGIDNLVGHLKRANLAEGLLKANEGIYHDLLYGISITQFIEGRATNQTISMIDWETPENNRFHYTEEMVIKRANSERDRIPDIVLFVNGIPFAVIEAKRPDQHGLRKPTIGEGISQMIRNQRNEEIPQLFIYTQLLLSINGLDGRYGTTGTPAKFWAKWNEEAMDEAALSEIKNRPVPLELQNRIFNDRPTKIREWYQTLTQAPLAVTGQDTLMISLLKKERLLEMVRSFILHDIKSGKIVARYQQYFGVKALLNRITQTDHEGRRQGGVIWHTTGSGKSYTMLFLSQALLQVKALKQCRIVVITDRVDLEGQLSQTFQSGGALVGKQDYYSAMVTSGRRLAEQIGRGNERIIFSLIQKFNTAAQLPECYNDSADIIVLIDEGHRSQGGENHQRMRSALPNAAFVAFTGTPLLKEDKTQNQFGSIIHAYTMEMAVRDKTVTPLLYEERKPKLDVNEAAIDHWFERITEGLTGSEAADLKRKFSRKGEIYRAEDRIRLIAYDVATHFNTNIDHGLKAQLACDSKEEAILYKKYLDEVGYFESAVVISPPDTREGNRDLDESSKPLVHEWWEKNVGGQDERDYTKGVIDRFEKDPNLKMLIVVDKLLTGFDEPQNAVLYIDKSLRNHNLMQAIARVNRLHEKKEFGLLIDYRGILAELDTAISDYQDLATRTQAGYAIEDIQGLYHEMSTEYRRLPMLYKKLWAIFDGVANKNDLEQLRRRLIPNLEQKNGYSIDHNQEIRDDFYEALSEFASCLKIALQSAGFYRDPRVTETLITEYKRALNNFTALRQIIQQDSGEAIDYDLYADKVKKLLDRYVAGVHIESSGNLYSLNRIKAEEKAYGEMSEDELKEHETEIRNKTDVIKTQITREIEDHMGDDPFAQEAFSRLLRKTIAEAEGLFDHPYKQLLLFEALKEDVDERRLDSIPKAIQGTSAGRYYGLFFKVVPSLLADGLENGSASEAKLLAFAKHISEIVDESIQYNSLDPDNIEKSIQKALLPKAFSYYQEEGLGLEQAKTLVELVKKSVRTGIQ